MVEQNEGGGELFWKGKKGGIERREDKEWEIDAEVREDVWMCPSEMMFRFGEMWWCITHPKHS